MGLMKQQISAGVEGEWYSEDTFAEENLRADDWVTVRTIKRWSINSFLKLKKQMKGFYHLIHTSSDLPPPQIGDIIRENLPFWG